MPGGGSARPWPRRDNHRYGLSFLQQPPLPHQDRCRCPEPVSEINLAQRGAADGSATLPGLRSAATWEANLAHNRALWTIVESGITLRGSVRPPGRAIASAAMIAECKSKGARHDRR